MDNLHAYINIYKWGFELRTSWRLWFILKAAMSACFLDLLCALSLLWRSLASLSQKPHQIHERRALGNSRSAKRHVYLWKQTGKYLNFFKRRYTHKEMNKEGWQVFRQQTLRMKDIGTGVLLRMFCALRKVLRDSATSRDKVDMTHVSFEH